MMWPGRGARCGLTCGAFAWVVAAGAALAVEVKPESPGTPAPAARQAVRLLLEGSGRFEVVALPGSDGVRLAALADAAWVAWAEPLGLPDRLPFAVTVRLAPRSDWIFGEASAWVAVDPSGVVSVWIRADAESGLERERLWLRALAEGALRRKAVLLGLDPAKSRAPRWLAAAAAEAALVAERPSLAEAWRAEFAEAGAPATLRDMLRGDSSDGHGREARARDRAAFGVWLWLRDESGKSGAWARFVAAQLGGDSSGAALAREFARLNPKPREAREWELAWKVAAARLSLARATPVFSAAESRERLERLARIVVLDLRNGRERVLPPWGEWATREEVWPRAVRAERSGIIEVDFTQIHPFYSNAAGSLGRAWGALAEGRENDWREASVEWSRDMADGRILEDASRALLDEAGG